MVNWTHIIIHHSWTGDTLIPDSTAIKRFHTSYRHYGDIITKDKYYELKQTGTPGLSAPWVDVGYHWLYEYLSDGNPWVIQGRQMYLSGAHTVGMNSSGIGCCFIGNFDDKPPEPALLDKGAGHIAWLCKMYNIPVANIKGHRDFASYKSCPGTKFNLDELRLNVSYFLREYYDG